LLNLRWAVWPQWHYAVVVGFDRTREEILLHSGLQARQVMSLQDFDRQWASAQRWGLLIRPPRRPAVSDGQAQPPPTG
jgi:ABC-type bacteriocin/lantibiotic exporter with double-glycine peptidase domain